MLYPEAVTPLTFIQEIEMAVLNEFGFHEATVNGLVHYENKIDVELEGVHLNGGKVAVHLEFHGVKQLFENGMPSKHITMEFEDAEVLSLNFRGDEVELILEWNDFSQHRSEIKSYRILCDEIVAYQVDKGVRYIISTY